MYYFLNGDGHPIIAGNPNDFSKNFDWIVTPVKTYRNKEIPETIYVKVDYLPIFVNDLLPTIKNNFKLITSCSDFSPSVNFPNEYNTIINNPFLVIWYAGNKVHEHEKVKAFPGGLCHSPEEIDKLLLSVSKKSHLIIKKNKVLCIWRDRNWNVCGNEYITRNKVKEFILQYPDIFDWVEPNINEAQFYELLLNYKYVLCPVGNGIDPCPKSFEAIALNTIPIFIRTNNTKDVYDDLPCILVDDFKEVIQPNFLDNNYDKLKHLLYSEETLHKISAEYWTNKIKTE
jgi:hypothetical protein